MKIGIITYDYPHLKTEQIVKRLVNKGYSLSLFALPFKIRKRRQVFFEHRPNQFEAQHPIKLAEIFNLDYHRYDVDEYIPNGLDYYLIAGAGILSKKCIEEKKIINCHPGLIPSIRGLDSFKWAIYESKQVGNTLHFIDEDVDGGIVIYQSVTPVYMDDTLKTFAYRHYQNEIDMLINFKECLLQRWHVDSHLMQGIVHKRMDFEKEKELILCFEKYKKIFGKQRMN